MHPVNCPEHIISVEADLAIITCNSFHNKVLFDNSKVKEIIKLPTISIEDKDIDIISETKKGIRSNIDNAIIKLNEAKKRHDELEKYYIEAMDFIEVERVKNKMIQKIDQLVV